MKKTLGALLLLLVSSLFCSAQDITFKHVVGRNPNSTEFRVQVQTARRNHTPLPSATPTGNDWAVGFGATSAGNTILYDQYPATWVNSTAPDCVNDFEIAYANGTPVVGGQANVLILNQLYRGAGPGLCGTGTAAVHAAYAVGTTPLGGSSAAVSFKGATRGLAFAILERANAKIHVVTIGTGGSASNAKAPTETVIDFTNVTVPHCAAGTVHTATHSDVWVDYSTDEGYVGDDAGRIYHISGIFNGTRTVDFCTTVNGGAYAALPEHLNVGGTDYVFFVSNGKRLYRTQVNATRTGFTNSQNVILSSIIGGISGSAILDSDDDHGYVWTNHDAAGTNSALYQIDLINGGGVPAILAELNIGAVETPAAGTLKGLYTIGTFDHTFDTLGAGATGATGYTAVYPTGSAGAPAIGSFQFNASGIITGFTGMTANTNINPTGTVTGNMVSALTETYDATAAADNLFVGTGNGSSTNANQVSRFNITTPLTTNGAMPVVAVTNISGGTSEMVIDWEDSGLGAQTQNYYFGNLAVPLSAKCGGTGPNFNSCIIKLQEAGLN